MIDALRTYQLDLMLILTGICALILFFSIVIKNLSNERRPAFILLNANTTILLLADRYAYVFRGDTSETGYYMVRITNYVAMLCLIGIVFFYNMLLKRLLAESGAIKETPKRLLLVDLFSAVAATLLTVSQFTGLYYTFDDTNHYQRSAYSFIAYIPLVLSLAIHLSIVLKHKKNFGKSLFYALLSFSIVPLVAGLIQFLIYGLSIVNMATSILVIVLYVIALRDMGIRAAKAGSMELDHLREQQVRMSRLLDQTATTLIEAIDSKEAYTQGHSARVATYAKQIAEYVGKDEMEQNQIYYAGLLHDIGKIGIPDEIINKKGKLTPEEYEVMKQHPVIGRHILSDITEMPYLAVGANFHHERYDGTGYPEGLKGDDIPEIGRILAVADAYDAMSSVRSYRGMIPQQKIREEFIKYTGTQFDPLFAKAMLHLIDLDSEYTMKEKASAALITEDTVITNKKYRDEISSGILITPQPTTIRFKCRPLTEPGEDEINPAPDEESGIPSLVLFDSLDGVVHTDKHLAKELNYFEYAELQLNGKASLSGAIDSKIDVNKSSLNGVGEYEIFAVRYRNHAMFTVKNVKNASSFIIALPDATRFMYIGLTGENCRITNISSNKIDTPIDKNYIPTIAEEVSYISGPEGDMPNVQVDGYRTHSTMGIRITDGLTLHFHTKSLPTAHLIWHCAFIDLYASDNGQVDGPNYKELALIRLDGEFWEQAEGYGENDMEIKKTREFVDWDDWKDLNKKGMDVTVRFRLNGDEVTTITENAGISIYNITKVKIKTEKIYVALTGDQVALTNIRTDPL